MKIEIKKDGWHRHHKGGCLCLWNDGIIVSYVSWSIEHQAYIITGDINALGSFDRVRDAKSLAELLLARRKRDTAPKT